MKRRRNGGWLARGEKCGGFLPSAGMFFPRGVLTAAISANSVQAAPVALAKSVTAVAVAKGAAASGSTLTLIKGALKLMAWTHAKTAVVAGVVIILALGTTTITVKEIQDHRTYPWQLAHSSREMDMLLAHAPPQVRILPAKRLDYG